MKKKSPSKLKGYQERYVIVDNNKLKYYKTDKSTIPKGVINFDNFNTSIQKCNKDSTKFRINISGVTDREFVFKA